MPTYVPDLNVMIYATEDCEKLRGEEREKCNIRKKNSLTSLEVMRGRCKYAKLPSQKYEGLMKGYGCEPIKVSEEDREKIEYFKGLLRSEAMRGGRFYHECTERVSNDVTIKAKMENISKSSSDDWEIIGKSFLAGDDVVLVTEDKHILNPFCKAVYEKAAEVAGLKKGKWDVKSTKNLARQILQVRAR